MIHNLLWWKPRSRFNGFKIRVLSYSTVILIHWTNHMQMRSHLRNQIKNIMTVIITIRFCQQTRNNSQIIMRSNVQQDVSKHHYTKGDRDGPLIPLPYIHIHTLSTITFIYHGWKSVHRKSSYKVLIFYRRVGIIIIILFYFRQNASYLYNKYNEKIE